MELPAPKIHTVYLGNKEKGEYRYKIGYTRKQTVKYREKTMRNTLKAGDPMSTYKTVHSANCYHGQLVESKLHTSNLVERKYNPKTKRYSEYCRL